jgi:hypothetical protein
VVITAAFPDPPPLVREAFTQLMTARVGLDDQQGLVGDPDRLPRPWDPPTCPPTLRREVWTWLDDVAAWINREYAWQPERSSIPACWPAHPHIAHELAVLACLRQAAVTDLSPDRLEDWHRYALPTFFERMASRLGTGCRPGHHAEWPSAGRYRDFDGQTALDSRHWAIREDTDPSAQGSTRPAVRLTVVPTSEDGGSDEHNGPRGSS